MTSYSRPSRMMNEGLEVSDLLEWTTLWPSSNAVADTFGNLRVGKRIEIPAGWIFRTDLSADPHSGATQVVGKVYVDRDVSIGSILFRGRPSEYYSGQQLYVAVGYNESRDVYDENKRRTVTIALWNGTLPEGV